LYENRTLAGLAQAVALLEQEIAAADPAPAAVLRRQRDHIQFGYLVQRSHYNWYEAGRYLVPGADPGSGRSMTEIVDDEIANTRAMIDLLDGRQARFVRTMHSDTMTYEFGPGFTGQLERRIAVMETHRLDRPRNLNDRLGKFQAYLRDMEQ
jgi:hypothetical protein